MENSQILKLQNNRNRNRKSLVIKGDKYKVKRRLGR